MYQCIIAYIFYEFFINLEKNLQDTSFYWRYFTSHKSCYTMDWIYRITNLFFVYSASDNG